MQHASQTESRNDRQQLRRALTCGSAACCWQASAFGSVPLQLTFRGETVAVERLHLGAPLFLVLVDLM